MRAISIDRALRLPLRLHGIQLGQPVDVLLDAAEWRVVGFELRCGDGSERFVPFATVRVNPDELAVGSALVLLEETAFYRRRARSFRSLLGMDTGRGVLRDLLVEPDGRVVELVVDDDGTQRRIAATRERRAA
jgi:hypothetical protein